MATAQTKQIEKVENPKIEQIQPIPQPGRGYITGIWENQYLRIVVYFDKDNESYKYIPLRCNRLKGRNILMDIEKNIDIYLIEKQEPPTKNEVLEFLNNLLKVDNLKTNEKIVLNPPSENETYIYLYKVIPYFIEKEIERD